jgi:hypothetical protein
VLIAKTEKVQDKEIWTGEGGGGGGGGGGLRQGVVFTLVCCTNAHPSVSHPCDFLLRSISVFHLETMDLPFPQCLISDPWQNGHLDISLCIMTPSSSSSTFGTLFKLKTHMCTNSHSLRTQFLIPKYRETAGLHA